MDENKEEIQEKEYKHVRKPDEPEVRKKKKKRRRRKKRMSVFKMIVLDLLVIGFGLVVFALFHHVLDYWGIQLGEKAAEPVVIATLPPEPTPEPTPSEVPQEAEVTPEPAAEATPEPTPEPTPTRVYSGVWGEKFADQFTDGEIIQTEDSYKSANVSVTITRYDEPGLVYYVADIYISDLKYLGSAFANGEGNGNYNSSLAWIDAISQRVDAVVAICGDHYYGRREGMVIRNGVLYRDTHNQDVCVIYTDGRMETIMDSDLDIEEVIAAAPWQVWGFGPGLLDADGHAKTFYDGQPNALSVNPKNPRCAIGYYEPGHYCFMKVEGNRQHYFIGSYGMTLSEMAVKFEELGCKCAYNLDGGKSAAMSWLGKVYGTNYDRTISDIIYITDAPVESEG